MSAMEARLKVDVLCEAACYERRLLVCRESYDGQVTSEWEEDVKAAAVMTPEEMFTDPAIMQACVNLTQACVNLTQACVNLTQACVNLTQACVNQGLPPGTRAPTYLRVPITHQRTPKKTDFDSLAQVFAELKVRGAHRHQCVAAGSICITQPGLMPRATLPKVWLGHQRRPKKRQLH